MNVQERKEQSIWEQYPQLAVSFLSMKILKDERSTHKINQTALLFIAKLYKYTSFSSTSAHFFWSFDSMEHRNSCLTNDAHVYQSSTHCQNLYEEHYCVPKTHGLHLAWGERKKIAPIERHKLPFSGEFNKIIFH